MHGSSRATGWQIGFRTDAAGMCHASSRAQEGRTDIERTRQGSPTSRPMQQLSRAPWQRLEFHRSASHASPRASVGIKRKSERLIVQSRARYETVLAIACQQSHGDRVSNLSLHYLVVLNPVETRKEQRPDNHRPYPPTPRSSREYSTTINEWEARWISQDICPFSPQVQVLVYLSQHVGDDTITYVSKTTWGGSNKRGQITGGAPKPTHHRRGYNII